MLNRLTRSPWTLPILLGVFCALQVFMRVVFGTLALTYDSWVYWESSISLLNDDGFKDLLGNPVVAWPPLFPVILAVWAKLVGSSLLDIKLLFVAVTFFNGLIWGRLVQNLTEGGRCLSQVLGFVYLLCFLPSTTPAMLSEPVAFLAIGLTLLQVFKREDSAINFIALGLLLSICLLCRNQLVTLIPGLCLTVLVLHGKQNFYRSLMSACFALVVWLCMRTYLQQWGAFSIDPTKQYILPEILGLLQISGALISVSKWHLNYIAAIAILIFAIIVIGEYVRDLRKNESSHRDMKFSLALLFLGASTFLGTACIGLMLGMPIAQPRWYMASPLLVGLAIIMLPLERYSTLIGVYLGRVLTILVVATSIYRASFFLIYHPSIEANLDASFSPSKAWIVAQLHEISDINSQTDSSLDASVKQLGKPYSANTVRRWLGQPLDNRTKNLRVEPKQ